MSEAGEAEVDVAGVAAFFTGRHVFITGATGFVGKVTVEKLLRSCPDVAGVHVLVRGKKGVEPRDRVTSLLEVKRIGASLPRAPAPPSTHPRPCAGVCWLQRSCHCASPPSSPPTPTSPTSPI